MCSPRDQARNIFRYDLCSEPACPRPGNCAEDKPATRLNERKARPQEDCRGTDMFNNLEQADDVVLFLWQLRDLEILNCLVEIFQSSWLL